MIFLADINPLVTIVGLILRINLIKALQHCCCSSIRGQGYLGLASSWLINTIQISQPKISNQCLMSPKSESIGVWREPFRRVQCSSKRLALSVRRSAANFSRTNIAYESDQSRPPFVRMVTQPLPHQHALQKIVPLADHLILK
ncbi:hypothetical protein FGO68_gene15182 [Halteria grandinella]|uniref:Uncharacterized protein n=1 Tax=Halteria grandinella TaxID=5974 RepID=A0A8J8T7A7_HALGN|nr:hypothetical protein FGO68_gene15182 [Halteria grandinella]